MGMVFVFFLVLLGTGFLRYQLVAIRHVFDKNTPVVTLNAKIALCFFLMKQEARCNIIVS